ncbi:MAG: hypothetical protein ABSH19_07065 [Opitutales bacterium]
MLQLLSIFLEGVIFVLCLRMALLKRKFYGYGLALTFGIYIFYDLAHHFDLHVTQEVLQTLFFVATVSALLCVTHLYYRNG